jgi:hypothetical protein
MKRRAASTVILLALIAALAAAAAFAGGPDSAPAGAIPRFRIEPTDINLSRPAQAFTYFDKASRKFGILGFESGIFEAWAYPLKILRGFEFAFLLGSSTVPLPGREIVRSISVDPAVTTLTFTDQSFTVRAHYVASVDEPGAVILLEVDSTVPLTVVCSFWPVLQPMWPAGIGGQYAFWDGDLKAYLVSEPTRKNHGYVGSPAAEGISYTPAHMLSDTPNQFKIEIVDPKSVAESFLPIILAGGRGKREDIRAVYQKIAADPEACLRKSEGHFRTLRDSTIRVRTGRRQVDLALEWAKITLDNLVVENPDLGTGLVAGLGPSGSGGRPGFGWYFGTDAYLNSLSFNSLGDFSASRDALSFSQKWQRKDGKMAHELSQAAGYLKWWEDYPYGYIHGDTTPFYIVAMEDYIRSTGDLAFLEASWPSLLKAYAWCAGTDGDGDGLMDNARAGLGALEFGELTGIQTDIYLASAWVRANRAMREMAAAVGDRAAMAAADKKGAAAAEALDRKFWDREAGQYSYAFNKDGRLVRELTPWSAVGLAWGLGSRERGIDTLAKLNSADLSTDWGVRMLSARSPLFEPLNYNYGAAWPFLTGWVSAALFKYGFISQGYETLMSNVRHTYDNALGDITELFSGYHYAWPQEGVPHQGFSTTGVVLPLVRGLLGLEGNALRKELVFEPRLPADWSEVEISNWTVGGKTFSVFYARRPGDEIGSPGSAVDSKIVLRVRTMGNAEGYRMRFSPALGLGTKIGSAILNGAALSVRLDTPPFAQSIEPQIEFALTGDDTVELKIDPGPEIIPPEVSTKTGDLNRGLKIIQSDLAGGELKITVEGLAGERYYLELRNLRRLEGVSGASLEGNRLSIAIPAGKPGEFVRQTIVLRLKD